MPYSNISELPASTKNLTKKQKEIFLAVFNELVYGGASEESAFPQAMAAAKKHKDSMKKSFAESLGELLEKFFGSPEQEQHPELLDEEMVSYEVIYEPFVKDAHGEWMSDVTIEKAMINFNKNLADGVVQPNLFHLKNTDSFTIESSWVQKELDVQVVQTGELIKAGTWVAKIKYNDENLWKLKKAQVIGGVSISGKGTINKKTGEITNVTFDGE